MSACKSCGAKIIWMKTKLGKNIPVDWLEEIEHKIEFIPQSMVAHFSTCPNAGVHRKKEVAPKPKREKIGKYSGFSKYRVETGEFQRGLRAG